MDENNYINFSKWLDNILTNKLPKNIVAFNFNLYEVVDGFSIQIIGSKISPYLDEDWACDNYFTSDENLFFLDNKTVGNNWEIFLNFVIKIVKLYLEEGNLKSILLDKEAVGIGFVDGDIELVYEKYKS